MSITVKEKELLRSRLKKLREQFEIAQLRGLEELIRICLNSTKKGRNDMAKKKVVKKASKSPAKLGAEVLRFADPEKVTVSMGLTLSANYQSKKYDVGATLRVEPGETPEEALDRCQGLVESFFTGRVHGVVERLDKFIT